MLFECIEKPLCIFREFPSSPVARTPHFHSRRPGVWFLVGELGSCKPHSGLVKKNNQDLNLAHSYLAEQQCRRETAPIQPSPCLLCCSVLCWKSVLLFARLLWNGVHSWSSLRDRFLCSDLGVVSSSMYLSSLFRKGRVDVFPWLPSSVGCADFWIL